MKQMKHLHGQTAVHAALVEQATALHQAVVAGVT